MSNRTEDAELLDELTLGSGRGGRRPAKPLFGQVVRQIDGRDLEELMSPTNIPVEKPVQAIRHAHHQLAQLLAKGVAQEEISAITGYSPSYVSQMKSMPMVAELVAHYATQRAQQFVDVAERMKVLGISAIEELQQRLMDDPNGWTKRELVELAKCMTGDASSRAAGANSGNGAVAPPVSLSIQFVTPAPQPLAATITIDHQDRELTNE